MRALTPRYTPGDPEPDPLRNPVRVILAWRKARDLYWEREQARKLEQERYARRDPQTLEEFEQAEKDKIARRERQAAIEAAEDRQNAERARDEQARQARQTAAKDAAFRQFWNATDKTERASALVAYAQSIGTADGYSGSGFSTQRSIDATLVSLESVTNCPSDFKARFRQIRGLTTPTPPPPTPEQRLATARQNLLGL